MPVVRRAVVIQHLAFEDLGTVEPALRAANFTIDVLQAGVADLSQIVRHQPDLLIVLGGPIGVYDRQEYPFLTEEVALLATRLEHQQPTLGICLGAQLMAAALGAKVTPGENGKEIGWSPITAPMPSTQGPLAPLFDAGVPVLHWHGDTFELPNGARHLASSARYRNQAFAIGEYGLALQFHAEVQTGQLERWYIGHAAELSHAGIKIPDLREQGRVYGPALEQASARLWASWLRSQLTP